MELTGEAAAAVMDLFAEIIARTFVRENPELLGIDMPGDDDAKSAGPTLEPISKVKQEDARISRIRLACAEN